ncbi:helix-turn-helix domain-containing protein [Pseudovibrio sp. Ad14]|uniref:helix-turn-helix transcriptional regulator n=1 Tax=Pseudovibrio sp. Ad14 TaxID=989397 RepID=UPI0023B9E1AC|nr:MULTISPECIES: helix-turn-helix domain-containing protein [unclassified Pseudovibrio]
MKPRQSAEYLQLSHATLAKWRSVGGGPSYSKLGSRVYYSQSDLDAFLKARKLNHTASRAPTDE